MQADQTEEMLPEYDFSNGVRGQYAERYAQGSNVVVLPPDVFKALQTQAEQQGVTMAELASSLLRDTLPKAA